MATAFFGRDEERRVVQSSFATALTPRCRKDRVPPVSPGRLAILSMFAPAMVVLVLLGVIGCSSIFEQIEPEQKMKRGLDAHKETARRNMEKETDKSLFVGVTDVNYMWMDAATIASRMWSIQNAGSKWIRVTFYWENIQESENGEPNWSKVDAIRDEAARKGVKILPVLFGFPPWAYRRPAHRNDQINCLDLKQFDETKCQPYPNGSYNYTLYQSLPPNKQDFIDFVKVFVARYKNDFKYWEVWNESNWCINGDGGGTLPSGPCWAPPEASVLGDIMKVVYPAIKGIDPDAQVILGGLSYNDLDFLHNYYVSTAGYNTFDILALHPYIGAYPDTNDDCKSRYPWPNHHRYKGNYNYCNWSGIEDIRNEMYWAGDIGKPIWITEFGWGQSDQRATWLRSVLQKTGSDFGFVDKIFYHTWSDHPGYALPDANPGFGLLKIGPWGNEILTESADVYADWGRESQKVNIQFPAFNQALNADSWYKFTGDFSDTTPYTASQVRLVLDKNEITSYPIQFETVNGVKKWYFVIQLRNWLKAFNTLHLPEHTVSLKVDCGGWIGTFYTSQTFRVSNP